MECSARVSAKNHDIRKHNVLSFPAEAIDVRRALRAAAMTGYVTRRFIFPLDVDVFPKPQMDPTMSLEQTYPKLSLATFDIPRHPLHEPPNASHGLASIMWVEKIKPLRALHLQDPPFLRRRVKPFFLCAVGDIVEVAVVDADIDDGDMVVERGDEVDLRVLIVRDVIIMRHGVGNIHCHNRHQAPSQSNDIPSSTPIVTLAVW